MLSELALNVGMLQEYFKLFLESQPLFFLALSVSLEVKLQVAQIVERHSPLRVHHKQLLIKRELLDSPERFADG